MTRDSDGAYVVMEHEYGDLLDSMKRRAPGDAPGNGRRRSAVALPSKDRATPANPPLAATLSLFVPGAGQLYNREGKLGAALFLTLGLIAVGHWSALSMRPAVRETAANLGFDRSQLLFTAFAIDFLAVFLFLWGIYQAYRRAECESGPYPGVETPLLPALASLLIPGWGQIANGQIGKALFFLLGLVPGAAGLCLLTLPIVPNAASIPLHPSLGISLRDAALGGIGLSVILWVVSVYDAGIVNRFRRSFR